MNTTSIPPAFLAALPVPNLKFADSLSSPQVLLTSISPLTLTIIICAVVAFLFQFTGGNRPYAGIAIVSLPRKGIQAWLPAKYSFMLQPRELLAKGSQEHPSVYQVSASSRYKIIVPNRFAEELKVHPDLDPNEPVAHNFFKDYPGFESFKAGLADDEIFKDTIRLKLTQSLGLVIDDIVDETNNALRETFGDDKGWTTKRLKQDMVHIISQVSSRVFLGKELASNAEWLEITERTAMDTFEGAALLHCFPKMLQPIVHWFIPALWRLRARVRAARRLIDPELAERKKHIQEAISSGHKVPKSAANTLGWSVEVAKGRPYDYVGGQLLMGLVAVHTTAEVTTQAVLQLCENPAIVEPLREEAIRVLLEEGWAKTTLSKLKLMDSFLKETQRVYGVSHATMNRSARKPVRLSDGTIIPKGADILVRDDRVNDPDVFPDPEKFDAYRYLRMRERPGEENKHQLVTSTADNMGFGHGNHACPGRFFASNAMKVTLCYLLLRYDLRLMPGETRPPLQVFEHMYQTPFGVQIQLRRRSEEIDVMNPKKASQI